MNEELINEINAIIHFATRFNSCKYVIVTDDISCGYRGEYVSIITHKDFNKKLCSDGSYKETEIEDINCLRELYSGAVYRTEEKKENSAIYIEVPYESDEFTLLRTLTHEYGHCLQNESGYNTTTCDRILLEYHNIWFNENPYNRDTLKIFDHIDRTTGFRLSYAKDKEKIDENNYQKIKDSFNLEFCGFYDKYKGEIKNGIEDKNKQLLRDIYNSVQVMRQENSLWLPFYYKLFYSYTKESKEL